MTTGEHNSSHSIPQPFSFGEQSLAGNPNAGGGVASLDEPLVAQTKREIRAIAAEIAQLASSCQHPEQFYEAYLPRLTTAMGAEAAGIWRCDSPPRRSAEASQSSSELSLEHEHQLAPNLVDDTGSLPSEQHRPVLLSALAEGKPILVPPSGATLSETRPANPSHASLILIPIRIDTKIDFLLEVVHKSRGGPAAQRGYLRFVTQMGDLLVDFLRRDEIRRNRQEAAHRDSVQQALLDIAGAQSSRPQVAVERCCELLNASQALLLNAPPNVKVQAVSGASQVDPRSEIALVARQIVSNRKNPAQVTQLESQLANALRCTTIETWPLEASYGPVLLLAGDETLSERCAEQANTLDAIVGLVGGAQSATRQSATPSPVRVWGMRALLVALLVLIGMLPIPQRISASAILQPSAKQVYYAPVDCIVAEVLCDESDDILAGQPLLNLRSPQLTTQINGLEGRREQALDQIREKVTARDRGSNLSASEIDQLEAEILQLEVERDTLSQQLLVLRAQEQELKVTARALGRVATWDLRNQLQNRPVSEGQTLLTTFDEQGGWEMELTIPENRVGLVSDAMANSGDGSTTVHFQLPSFPQQHFEARLQRLAATTTSSGMPDSPSRVVMGKAQLSGDGLPVRKDGALALATIDCGRVPLAWLVIRDAYWVVRSQAEMLF